MRNVPLFNALQICCWLANQSFGQKSAELCPCDLTRQSCDVNCCCDPDCEGKFKLFSVCAQRTRPAARCLSTDVVLINNAPSNFTSTSDSLLCVYYDNNDRVSVLETPEPLQTEADISRLIPAGPGRTPPFTAPLPHLPPYPFPTHYRVGDAILVIRKEVVGELSLPAPSLTDVCSQSSPIGVLQPSSHSCLQSLSDLRTKCGSSEPTILSASFFIDPVVVKTPDALESGLADSGEWALSQMAPSSLVPIGVRALSRGGVDLDPAVVPAPAWDPVSASCNSVVLETTYHIQLNATSGGVTGVDATIRLGSVSDSERFLRQGFSVDFSWDSDTASSGSRLELSGNPGYEIGKPVMSGRLQRNESTDSEAILLSLDPHNWLTVPTGVFCKDTQERLPVLFGQDLVSGCLVELDWGSGSADCRALETEIRSALRVSPSSPWYRDRVAGFANASHQSGGDWVPILGLGASPNRAESDAGRGCKAVTTGLRVLVLFALTGHVLQPQHKIIGVEYQYLTGNIQYQAVGGLGPRKEKFGILLTVEFVDVTSEAVAGLSKIQTFDAKLPEDFFFPFTGASPASFASPIVLLSSLTLHLSSM